MRSTYPLVALLVLLAARPASPQCDLSQTPIFDARDIEGINKNLGCNALESQLGGRGQDPLETEHGKLSTLWAQEEVGADLSKDFLRQWDASHPDAPSRETALGVLDIGFEQLGPAHEEHGTLVSNLMVGPVGVAGHARITRFDNPGALGKTDADAVAAFNRMAEPGRGHPDVVNLSIGLGESTTGHEVSSAVRGALEAMSATGIAVHSAGNSYPRPVDGYLSATNGIVVGSLTPEGLASYTSSEGAAVTIAAPSDYSITSANRHMTLKRFSGTSGAAPLVSGAIANVASLLPGLSTREAAVLLRHTAIATPGFNPSNGKNGAGALNAYAMLRVAERLRSQPGGWPGDRALLKEPAPDQAVFDFRDEAADLKRRGLALLDQTGCDKRVEAVRLLRTSFFLNPTDAELRGALAAVYRAEGLVAQASYVEGRSASETLARIKDASVRVAVAIHAGVNPETLVPDSNERREAYRTAFKIKNVEGQLELVRRSVLDSDPSVRLAFEMPSFGEAPGWTHMLMNRAALEAAAEPTLRARIVHESCTDLSSRLLESILEVAVADSSAAVRQEVTDCQATCREACAADLASKDKKVRAAGRWELDDCRHVVVPEI